MRYFTNCRTAEQAKAEYKRLAKELHPDNGGDEEQFKEMQAEFTELWKRIKNIHTNSKGEQYTKETNENVETFMWMVERITRMQGVDLELIGSWLWATGNTKPYKDELKTMGFIWSSNKKAWYFNGEQKGHRRGHYSLNEIRTIYGTQKFNSKAEKLKQIETA